MSEVSGQMAGAIKSGIRNAAFGTRYGEVGMWNATSGLSELQALPAGSRGTISKGRSQDGSRGSHKA